MLQRVCASDRWRSLRTESKATVTAMDKSKILVVDDDARLRFILKTQLAASGFSVREAEDGGKAMRTLETESVDLVLTDIDMPNVDGIELIQFIRAESRWRNLPIIVLSTRGSTQDKQRAVAAGADSYLVKTEFSEAALREALSGRLEKRARR